MKDLDAIKNALEHGLRRERVKAHGLGNPLLYDEALTALAKLREQTQWQPIETAPKDGTEIIGAAWYKYGDFSAHIEGPWTIAFYGGKWQSSWDGSEVVNYMSDFGTDYKEPELEPTHWMPLPNPPAGGNDE